MQQITPIDGKLSLILPARNEEGNVERVVGHSIDVLNQHIPDWEIIIINDGSRDRTGEIAEAVSAREPRVRVVHHPHNRGYGSAWRSGFEGARGEYIMCMDSDGQFDLADITLLLPYVNHYDIVAGYRMQRQDPLHRKINSAIFGLAVALLFGITLRDIDCGFKIFRGGFIRSLDLQAPGALINLEIFALARQRNASIIQVGVHHYPREAGVSTGAKPSVVLQAMREILLLRLRLLRGISFFKIAAPVMAAFTALALAAYSLGSRKNRSQ